MIDVGMDQHKRFSYAASMNSETGEMTEGRLEHNAPEEIRSYIRSLGPQVRVSLETTGNWYWLCDLLEEEGAQVQLANTVETRRLQKSRAKNDRLDALALAQMSRQGVLPQVYIPPRVVRDDRERHRYRIRLVRMQSALKNAIHAVLSKLNIGSCPESGGKCPAHPWEHKLYIS
jgi:transposase